MFTINQCQKLHPLVALPLSVIYCPSPLHLLNAVNSPAVIHFLKLSINCHYFGYLDMLPYIQSKLHLKDHDTTLVLLYSSSSLVQSFVTEMEVIGQSLNNIFGENIPVLCPDLLSYLTTKVHLFATYLFATNFFGKYIVISDMMYFTLIYVDYL